VSGTRRVDGIKFHLPEIRESIHNKIAPHICKGEEVYYEIFGYKHNWESAQIQSGYPYGCKRGQWKCMLYRVTITTEDGYRIDLDREQVYRRAEELGLEKPVLLDKFPETELTKWDDPIEVTKNRCNMIIEHAKGQSALDPNTLREGIVVWFQDCSGNWTCLKHKSEEFLLREDKNRQKGIEDVEDEL